MRRPWQATLRLWHSGAAAYHRQIERSGRYELVICVGDGREKRYDGTQRQALRYGQHAQVLNAVARKRRQAMRARRQRYADEAAKSIAVR